ncbi:MAG TPA: DUF4932 domain-containing protein [Anaerolineae bacterium]
MFEASVMVKIDERARLVAAVLAASNWPEREQAQLAHAVHPHAKQTRQFTRQFGDHPAVQAINEALQNDIAIDEPFTAALRGRWPDFALLESLSQAWQSETWVQALADFARETAIGRFWTEHEGIWAEALSDLQNIFRDSQLVPFLSQLQGQAITQSIAIMPNLVYPALITVLATTAEKLFLLLPPPKAIGESPPWPYREDSGFVLAQACDRLAGHLMAAELARLGATQQVYLKRAAVTLFLEQEVDEAEAMAYLVRSKKEHNLPQLPLMVEQLRQRLERGDWRFEIGDWLNL